MKFMVVAGLLYLGLSATSRAQNLGFSPAEAYLGLAGQWTGSLSYRDYSSDIWFDLAEHRTIVVLKDGHSVMETSAYDDGPKTGLVYTYTLSAIEPDGRTLKSLSTRKNQPASTDIETLSFKGTPASAEDFTLVFDSVGKDDDHPARLRITLTRKGTHLETLKEVNPDVSGKGEWRIRNRTRLDQIMP